MSRCLSCKKPTPEGHNFCEWECHVNYAIMNGGKELRPNHLPVKCIRHDNLMLEHAHGDHPDYKFPVEVTYLGQKPDLPEWDDSYGNQTHALIYTDGYIAVTMYECTYAMWYVRDGMIAGGSLWKKDRWQLSDLALEEIRKRWPA